MQQVIRNYSQSIMLPCKRVLFFSLQKLCVSYLILEFIAIFRDISLSKPRQVFKIIPPIKGFI